MSRRRRLLVILAVVFVALGMYVAFRGFETSMVVEARYLGWKYPTLKQVPQALPEAVMSGGPGQKVS
jgi:hypothetical protein